MNITIDDLYNMNPKNFANSQIGFGRLHQQKEQGEWERARWIACVIINPHLKRAISPDKITSFPWEVKKKRKNKVDIDKLIKESILDDKIQQKIKNKNNA